MKDIEKYLPKFILKLLEPYRGLPKEVYVIFVSRIVNAIGCFVGPFLTLILTKKIGLSSDVAGFYMSAAGLLYIPASIIGGKLSDTLGRRKVIILFDTLAIIVYMVCGFVQPSMTMVYLIMLAGTCMSAAGPAHDSLMADLTTPENRNGAYALSYMGWNLGFAIGPLLAGMLFENHLNLIFIGDALTALLSLTLIIFFVRETIGNTKEDISDASRFMERRESGSIISVLLRRPALLIFAIVILGYNFTYAQWGFMMPMHAGQNFGDKGAAYYGYMASFNGIVVIAFTPLITWLLRKIKHLKKIFIGGLLYAVGFGMLGIYNTLAAFFISVFVFTIGEIILSISTMPFIADNTPMSHRGRMSGVLGILFGFGYTISPMVMGTVIKTTGIEQSWLYLGIFVAISSTCIVFVERAIKKQKQDQLALIESEQA
ncbi:MAG: transporter [Clostridia bacterium]|jgi:MFS family permease|nr:transporter [Clostridia bacterium]